MAKNPRKNSRKSKGKDSTSSAFYSNLWWWLRVCLAAVVSKLVADYYVQRSQPTLNRQFQSFHSDVYVIDDFLPTEVALDWRRRMLEAWENTQELLKDCEGGDSCPNTNNENSNNRTFHFATNNDGFQQGDGRVPNNAKVRSLEQLPQRNHTAHQMRQRHMFAYAKWELPPAHVLVQEMEDYMRSNTTRQTVARLLADKHPQLDLQPQLADLFVTYYNQGDFLTTHNDNVCGTWAFVVSLTQEPDEGPSWNNDMGGTLRFQCPHTTRSRYHHPSSPNYWCESLVPKFNTALLFNTRLPGGVMGPNHEVLPVHVPPSSGYFRFGLTGWYMDAQDVMDETAKAELNKMRSRD
ncbi:expressed unknown protein [Seminavis robusta]|uniref:Prolyl 4-hydroxylase alpha subunit domain-containing protein n=1 Tax=Seminavis robusta TaxID=568900 RepID=A0A9N8DXP9_9STRA|nr:expressed unknown protein [Seminavis robusta]|eukprot:Sro427_g140680.1 n/a (350) ;mRNA; f:42167-43216